MSTNEEEDLQRALLLSLHDEETPVQRALTNAPPPTLKLLLRYLKNVATYPEDEKYTHLNMMNAAFMKVWSDPFCAAVFKKVGFDEKGHGKLVFDATDAVARDRVHRAVQELEDDEKLGPPPAASLPQPQANVTSTGFGAGSAAGVPAPSSTGGASRWTRHIPRRQGACVLCDRNVRQHGWPPKGRVLMRARAPWEGVQCDTCAGEGGGNYVICGECYNNSVHLEAGGHDVSHAWSPIGYGPNDEGGGFRPAAPPPPPNSNRRGAWG